MSSSSKSTETKRAAHLRKAGKKRKKSLAAKGTTRSAKVLFTPES